MLLIGTSAAAVPAARTSQKEESSVYAMGRFSTVQPRDCAMEQADEDVTLLMTDLESGTTRAYLSSDPAPPGCFFTPMKPDVLNSSTYVLV